MAISENLNEVIIDCYVESANATIFKDLNVIM